MQAGEARAAFSFLVGCGTAGSQSVLCARGNKTGLPGSQFKVVFFPWSARDAGFKTSDMLSRLNLYHADVGHL